MSTSAADAPVNDLQLIQDMFKYEILDPQIAEAVLQKMEKHRWYLTQETALFSSRLSDKQKRDIAAQLHATEKPDSFRRGKPVFQLVTTKTTLVHLIGPESHLLFDILNIRPDWLLDPVESWPENDDYQKALEYVANLKVANDVAERGVKMMSDFANVITTDPKQREYLLQAVEYNRRHFESF